MQDAPRTFRLSRFARPSAHAAAPFTSGTEQARVEDERAVDVGRVRDPGDRLDPMIPASTNSSTPLICALMISLRLRPNVNAPFGGRWASRSARIARPIAAASVSMCAASLSSASELRDAHRDLDDHEAEVDQQRDEEPARVAARAHPVRVAAVLVMGVVVAASTDLPAAVSSRRRPGARAAHDPSGPASSSTCTWNSESSPAGRSAGPAVMPTRCPALAPAQLDDAARGVGDQLLGDLVARASTRRARPT